jgi:hypothetical protein
MTARSILGCRYTDLLQQNGPELRIVPSDKPEEWPDDLRRRIKESAKANGENGRS